MATMADRVSRWLRSPQGQRLATKAQRKARQLAGDPGTRARLGRLSARLRRKR